VSNGDEDLRTAVGEDSRSDLEWSRLDIGWSRSYNGEGVSDDEDTDHDTDSRSKCHGVSVTRDGSEASGGGGSKTMASEDSGDGIDPSEGADSRSEDRRASVASKDPETAENKGSEIVESENSQIVTGKDSRDCSDSPSVGPRASDEDEYSKTVTDEDLGNASDSSADKVLSDGERSSSSNLVFAGSSTRSRLSDVHGTASQLFSKTGDSIFCSSRPSDVADELIERVLFETLGTDLSNVENSRGGKDLGDGSDSSDVEGSYDAADPNDGADLRSESCDSRSDDP